MRKIRLCLLTFSFLFFFFAFAEAQKKNQKSPAKKTTQQKTPAKKTDTKSTQPKKTTEEKKPVVKTETKKTPGIAGSGDPTKDEQKVKDIVSFLQFVLNTLGSGSTSSRDKDVLITQSYSKIFRDEKVQVEDDLDESRETITNKDVVAYLKDVDFFYDDVKFEFNIESITNSTLPNGNLFYKVSTRRTLAGTNSEGEKINNTQPRFIEINFNPDDQDLKIVSMYTKEFNEKEALTNWWKELSYEWNAIFRKQTQIVQDSLSLNDIKRITAIETLDLGNNAYISNIEPLAQLTGLKNLNLSGTKVTDLTPIRNLTELVELNLSNTAIEDLAPLKYSTKLKTLNVSRTSVGDIFPLEKMTSLEKLDISRTKTYDFTVLSMLTQLKSLNLNNTQIAHLTPLENVTQLTELDLTKTLVQNIDPLKNQASLELLTIDSTRINNISAAAALVKLKVLRANNTSISDLQPLQSLKQLERVYCDHTSVTREKADAFMKARPGVLVIFDSKDLKAWWDALTPEWQSVLRKTAKINASPSKEDLATVTNLDSVNFQGNPNIFDLEPLKKLLQLRSVNASGTSIKDLSPLDGHRNIEYLNIDNTNVTDIFIVRQFTKLKEFRADQSKVGNIDALFGIKSLQRVYVDHTSIHDITALEFLQKNPSCLLIYKTHHIQKWWQELSPEWRDALREQMKDTTSTRENLHRLVELEKVVITDAPVRNLDGFKEFVRLKDAQLSGTAVSAVAPLENLRTLRSLKIANGPLQQIEFLAQLKDLESLDISNTPIDELKPLAPLDHLITLNCAGTQIKKIDPLQGLDQLQSLDCSNTKVGSLDAVKNLPLKTLKCYNTKVSSREVEKFKEKNKDCNVVFYK